MTYPLRISRGFLRTPVYVETAATSYRFQFALDTGASVTVLDRTTAATLGLDATTKVRESPIVTATRVDTAEMHRLARLAALGRTRRDVHVLVVELPDAATVDGLLGLDFLGSGRLVLDFDRSVIRLEE